MATPGQLVETIAEALGKPAATITQHDRVLAAAGLRAMKGRGRGAAHVTARDAAHELVAVLGSDLVVDSAASVNKYAMTLPMNDGGPEYVDWTGFVIPELAALSPQHSFNDALEALILSFQSGSYCQLWSDACEKKHGRRMPIPPAVRIRLQSPFAIADLECLGYGHPEFHRSVRYVVPSPDEEDTTKLLAALEEKNRQLGIAYSDLTQWREITGTTIGMIADRLNN
ncbi:hypothetical protein [Methylobacterium sp. Leaf100]|uniref:hypothetical protein n=1 Tax=Methylobacterium sp. Leaf100 TaxID=1736252 RepID=UPI000A6A1DED|nr:hypothetical protein [Methylobacterium sp. Leaf100]